MYQNQTLIFGHYQYNFFYTINQLYITIYILFKITIIIIKYFDVSIFFLIILNNRRIYD